MMSWAERKQRPGSGGWVLWLGGGPMGSPGSRHWSGHLAGGGRGPSSVENTVRPGASEEREEQRGGAE